MKKFLLNIVLALLPVALFADEAPAAPSAPTNEQGLMQTVVMIGIALLFFYVILWRPEQKRRKAQETQRNALKKGDRVNAMGILGTVNKVNENTVILQMVDGAKIEFLKLAITDVLPATEETKKTEE